MVTKINPVFVNEARSFAGKTVSEFALDFNADIDASLDPNEAVDAVLKTVQLRANVLMHSSITGTGELMTIFVEGEFPDSDYDGDGSDETFAAVIQADIRALGTVDSLDLSGATATAGVVYKA